MAGNDEIIKSIVRLETKVDHYGTDIRELKESHRTLRDALVGNGDPEALLGQMNAIRAGVVECKTGITRGQEANKRRIARLEECVTKQTGQIEALEHQQAQWKNRAWGISAAVTLIWTIGLILLGLYLS